MSRTQTFLDLAITGDVLLEEVDDYVDAWHASDNDNGTLAEYLGMSTEEYGLWLSDPTILPCIVIAHRDEIEIQSVLESVADTQTKMAARSDSKSNAELLQKWLRDEKYR